MIKDPEPEETEEHEHETDADEEIEADEPGPIIPGKGERALVAGQTGSGKTQLMVWLAERLEGSPVIIYDTKEEPKYSALPYSAVAVSQAEVDGLISGGEHDYIIFRPPVRFLSDPAALDDLLMYHYENYRNYPAVIDEIYSFHIGGRAGPGLIGILTRGRSRGITTLMGTQRPARFDRFAITEAQKIFAFRFADMQDRKRLGDVIPDFQDLPLPKKFGFYFYEVGTDAPILYDPIPIDQDVDPGYTDEVEETDNAGAAATVKRNAFF